MSRRSIIKETEEDLVKEAEVVMRWSKKRIVMATILAVCIIAGGVYALSLLGQNASRVLGAKTADKPQIQIPNEKNVQDVIDSAKEDLSNINAKNIVESQPKIKKIIEDLNNLTGSSSSAKSLICDTLCK
jgi:cytochrome c-type biogenesis protein CcmH/NrfG